MKNNKFLLAPMFLSLIYFIFNPFFVSASADNKYSIQVIINRIDKIQKYQVNLTTKLYPPNASDIDPKVPYEFDPDRFIEVKSVVFGEAGKKMRLLTIMNSTELCSGMEHTLIFDGTWLWIQQKVNMNPQMKTIKPKITAMKIHIPSVSPDPVNEPFNTFYGISGTGLYRDQDLPGTFAKIIESYDFRNTLSSNNSDKRIFKGHRINDKILPELEGANKEWKELKALMEKTTQFCKLWVSKKTGLIIAYSMGQSEERPTIFTEIEYISVNEKLRDDTFTYTPPEGVVVKDITSTILEKKEVIKEKMGN